MLLDILWQQVMQSVLSEPVTQVVKLMVLSKSAIITPPGLAETIAR